MDESSDSIEASHKRVLIVDDHPDMAAMLARAVSQAGLGVEILSACSGKDALILAADQPVEVLVTDLMMPEMDGIELIHALRSRPSGVLRHTILITAYDVSGLAESAARLNLDHVIFKPFAPGYLIHLLRMVLKQMDGSAASPDPRERIGSC